MLSEKGSEAGRVARYIRTLLTVPWRITQFGIQTDAPLLEVNVLQLLV